MDEAVMNADASCWGFTLKLSNVDLVGLEFGGQERLDFCSFELSPWKKLVSNLAWTDHGEHLQVTDGVVNGSFR